MQMLRSRQRCSGLGRPCPLRKELQNTVMTGSPAGEVPHRQTIWNGTEGLEAEANGFLFRWSLVAWHIQCNLGRHSVETILTKVSTLRQSCEAVTVLDLSGAGFVVI